ARREQVQAAKFNQLLRRTNWITLAILCMFLVASAIIALLDPYTGMNLQGMLGLNSEVTHGQILLIIVVGGFGLMVTQLLLGRVIGKRAYACRVS
ncbi:MAG: hypothetical protein MUO40_05390, partial [Anaerolineaceae bacterium]|nr:hypothetical protein [Anaerolineaceae bacterium]